MSQSNQISILDKYIFFVYQTQQMSVERKNKFLNFGNHLFISKKKIFF